MPQDPQKRAELDALAQGGPQGLASYQAAQAQARAVQQQALSAAGGYGTGNYRPDAGSVAQAQSTAARYSAPGVAAAESIAAAGPGYDAMDSAAASNYMSRESAKTQSRLALAQAKVDLERQQDAAEREAKLAELAFERDKIGAETQYQLSDLAIKEQAFERARALDPERVTGQAMQNQADAVERSQGEAGLARAGEGLLDWVNERIQHAKEQQQAKADEIKARANPEAPTLDNVARDPLTEKGNAVTITEQIDPNRKSVVADPAKMFRQAAAANQWETARQQELAQAQALADSLGVAASGSGGMRDKAGANADAAAGRASLQSIDLPSFLFEEAVGRGMDPDVAAGKFLAKRDDYIRSEKNKAFEDAMAPARQEQAAYTADQQAAKREQQAEAAAAAERTGWDPRDLVSLSNSTNMSISAIADRVTSDAWKRVDEFTQKAGAGGFVLDEADAKALGDETLAGGPMDSDAFWRWLQTQKDLDPAARQIAFKRYSQLFQPVPNNPDLEG